MNFQNWHSRYQARKAKHFRIQLEVLLSMAEPQMSFQSQVKWMILLFEWLQDPTPPHSSFSNTLEAFSTPLQPLNSSSARLAYLVQALRDSPLWHQNFRINFIDLILQMSSLELFSEVGLSHEASFLNEIYSRCLNKVLLEGALQKNKPGLLAKIFPDRQAADWLLSLKSEVVEQFVILLMNDEIPAKGRASSKIPQNPKGIDSSSSKLSPPSWSISLHLENAIYLLVSQIRAVGLCPQLRQRSETSEFRSLPYFSINQAADRFILAIPNASDGAKAKDDAKKNSSEYTIDNTIDNAIDNARDIAILVAKNQLLEQLQLCRANIREVLSHLDQHGVSVSTVHQIDRLQKQIERVEYLVHLRSLEKVDADLLQMFVAQLVTDVHQKEDLLPFIEENLRLLMRKIVERNSETGKLYIASTTEEYMTMFTRAVGGGAITAITVLVKMAITSFQFSLFFMGFLASLNYALSFLVIHFLHYTLATKQPASTAPALAAKIDLLENDSATDINMQELLTMITLTIRTQFAAIFGNIVMVAPTVVTLTFMYRWVIGQPAVSVQKAAHIIESVDVFGPSLLYASFTGFLLFLSSLIAGWADNWFALYNLSERIATNEILEQSLGSSKARALGMFFKKNAAALAANISLGFLLGLLPEIFKFIGLPLDIRHVTLSTGMIFSTVATFGWQVLHTPEFVRACFGVLTIGTLNVAVSFGFALVFSFYAKGWRATSQRKVLRLVLHRIRSAPLSFLLPTPPRFNSASLKSALDRNRKSEGAEARS